MTGEARGAGAGFSITFWGVRGSFPVSGADQVRFGGDTICFEIGLAGRRVIIDAGTGLRRLGAAMAASGNASASLLLTHFHLDHVIGLTAFEALRSPAADIRIYAPTLDAVDLRSKLGSLLAEPFFPVPFDRMCGIRSCHDFVPGVTLAIGDHQVRTIRLNHGVGACGYRFDHAGKALAIITDHEHHGARPEGELVDFCRNADLIVYDAMWDEQVDYDPHRGWGHSSWQAGLRLLRQAKAGRLVCIHHAPTRSDEELARREALLQREHSQSLFAYQDLSLIL